MIETWLRSHQTRRETSRNALFDFSHGCFTNRSDLIGAAHCLTWLISTFLARNRPGFATESGCDIAG